MSLYLGNRRIAPIIRTAGQSGLKILVVESLPTQDIATDAIYLVPKQNPSTNDYYDEYIYVDNAWEIFGEDGAVSSVNNKTGAVVIGASDVGALPADTPIHNVPSGGTNGQVLTKSSNSDYELTWSTPSGAVSSVNGKTGNVVLSARDVEALPSSTIVPTKTSQLTNDSGFITSVPVVSVNNKTGAVNLTANDVGALPNYTTIPTKTSDLVNDNDFITASQAPVQSVNGQTGTVNITIPEVPSPSSTVPSMDGTASAGTSANYARADHIHPSDTSKVDETVVDGSATTEILNGRSNIKLSYIQGNKYSDIQIRNGSPSLYASVGSTDNALTVTYDSTIIKKVVTPTENGDATNKQYVDNQVATKQNTLVSGTNIKTINNESLLGSGNINIQSGAVDSVNGQTGVVVLDAEDVGALPNTTAIPTKTSDLTNDSGFVTSSGVTRIDLNTSAEPYSLPINSAGVTTLDIGDGLTVSDSSGVELKHKTGAGYNHIPSGGSSGQFLGYSSNGTATWQTLPTPTIPTKTSDLVNDSNFITSAEAPVQSVNGQTGTVNITIPTVPTNVSVFTNDAGYVNASEAAAASPVQSVNGNTGDVTINIPTKTSDLTNDSEFITGMTILSYGSSTWQDFLDAYSANKVVYARASSNANPATGSQTRLAFMAYVNNAANPTSVEFQYYRSVSSHSATQQGDQVFVYTLKSTGWSVITREASVKVIAGTNMTQSYSNDKLTLNAVVPTNVSSFTNDAGYLTLADLPVYQGGVS